MSALLPALVLAAALAPPARIVSLSPSVTEILDGVGAFDRVVAVSTYCEYPPEVKSLPRVGGWTDTNLEQVLGLSPDLVILTDAQAPLVEQAGDIGRQLAQVAPGLPHHLVGAQRQRPDRRIDQGREVRDVLFRRPQHHRDTGDAEGRQKERCQSHRIKSPVEASSESRLRIRSLLVLILGDSTGTLTLARPQRRRPGGGGVARAGSAPAIA